MGRIRKRRLRALAILGSLVIEASGVGTTGVGATGVGAIFDEASRVEARDRVEPPPVPIQRIVLDSRAIEDVFLEPATEPELAAMVTPDWDSRREPLQDFQLEDLQGNTWVRDDLLGQVTMINLWATWCPPCHRELPLVEELHQRLTDHPHLAAITLNVDEDSSLILPFLEGKGMDFPVLLARSYFDTLEISRVVPQTWIVDGHGVIRRGQIGFRDVEEPAWVAEAVKQMEEVLAVHGLPIQPVEEP